jgi:hypothetical protein
MSTFLSCRQRSFDNSTLERMEGGGRTAMDTQQENKRRGEMKVKNKGAGRRRVARKQPWILREERTTKKRGSKHEKIPRKREGEKEKGKTKYKV